MASGDPHAATLCWICASNVDAAVQQWSSAVDHGGPSVNALQATLNMTLALSAMPDLNPDANPNPNAHPAPDSLTKRDARRGSMVTEGLAAAQHPHNCCIIRAASSISDISAVPS